MIHLQNLCQNKATTLGIRTARLPIGTYLANMPTRKVLTVNQVRRFLSTNCVRIVLIHALPGLRDPAQV